MISLNSTEEDRALVENPDDETRILYLEVPGSKVVLLQSFFELYEGLGLVRTIDIRSSQVCIITTTSQLDDSFKALYDIREAVPWRLIAKPDSIKNEKNIFFKKANRSPK